MFVSCHLGSYADYELARGDSLAKLVENDVPNAHAPVPESALTQNKGLCSRPGSLLTAHRRPFHLAASGAKEYALAMN